ncbi:ATP-binding protein [Candidatus Woesearchaeota archaeon]|nr:ATP-binding protein [Candidatus Woesearchaeota archaeon]
MEDYDISTLEEEGKNLLEIIPNKSDFSKAEQKVKESSASPERKKSQIKILKKDHDDKLKVFQKKYFSWFNKCLKVADEDTKKELTRSKDTISIYQRINSALKIIKNLEKNEDIEIKETKYSLIDKKIRKIILQGENDQVEFKSSLRWDYNKNELNKFLELPIMKTISAFLNSEGGILLIGVDDSGKILGIGKDYPTLRKQDADGFIQFLVQMINTRIGKEYNENISAHIKNVENKDVCIINVDASNSPVFVRYDNKEEFYIRASATSQPLNVREATDYIKMHWKN